MMRSLREELLYARSYIVHEIVQHQQDSLFSRKTISRGQAVREFDASKSFVRLLEYGVNPDDFFVSCFEQRLRRWTSCNTNSVLPLCEDAATKKFDGCTNFIILWSRKKNIFYLNCNSLTFNRDSEETSFKLCYEEQLNELFLYASKSRPSTQFRLPPEKGGGRAGRRWGSLTPEAAFGSTWKEWNLWCSYQKEDLQHHSSTRLAQPFTYFIMKYYSLSYNQFLYWPLCILQAYL